MPPRSNLETRSHSIPQNLAACAFGILLLVLTACAPSDIFKVAPRFYKGRVVDKMAYREETVQGTFFRRILVIEAVNGDRLQVGVDERVFREAQTGLWIESDKTGVRVSGLNPTGKEAATKSFPSKAR
jgi:hypothetical protein